jgi:hypothetical protein
MPMPKAHSKYGEFFPKNPVKVLIQTNVQKISGTIHIHPDMRIKDDLDRSEEDYMVVTGAQMAGSDQEFDYVLVHRKEIVWLAPLENEK